MNRPSSLPTSQRRSEVGGRRLEVGVGVGVGVSGRGRDRRARSPISGQRSEVGVGVGVGGGRRSGSARDPAISRSPTDRTETRTCTTRARPSNHVTSAGGRLMTRDLLSSTSHLITLYQLRDQCRVGIRSTSAISMCIVISMCYIHIHVHPPYAYPYSYPIV